MYWLDKQYLLFNGKNTLDFECRISGGGRHKSSSWDVQRVQIPGRDGDVILPNNRVGNVDITYKASIGIDFERNYKALRDHFMQDGAYHRLEDTYDPDIFMIARFEGDLDPNIHQTLEGAEFELHFSAKPMRYLKSGEFPIDHTYNSKEQPLVLKNPTNNYANPLIEIDIPWATGAGTNASIDHFVVHFANIYENEGNKDKSGNSYYKLVSTSKIKWPGELFADNPNGFVFFIDSETQEIWAKQYWYSGLTPDATPEKLFGNEIINCNGMFTIENDLFPRFEKGTNHLYLEIRDILGNKATGYYEFNNPIARITPRWFIR